MPPKSLLDRIAEAARQPARWRFADVPRERWPQAEWSFGCHFLAFRIAIDDDGDLSAFIQIGRAIPLRLGLFLPGAPGREHLIDLLLLPGTALPVDPAAWLASFPKRFARGAGPESAARIDLARDVTSLAVLRQGRPGVRWYLLGPQIYLAHDPEDAHPLHARGGTLPTPLQRALLAGVLLPDPSVAKPKPWGEAADHLEGQALEAFAHARVALEAKIAEDARQILGPRHAVRLLGFLQR